MRKDKKHALSISALALLANVFIILFSSINIFIPLKTIAAGNVKLLLTSVSPTSFIEISNGTNIQIGLSAQNTIGVKVAEIVLSYDPQILSAQSIVEDSNILALNKSTTTQGKVTVDIANTLIGDFEENKQLIIFNFKVLNNQVTDTTIKIESSSTFGYPNQLSTPEGYGTLKLVFKNSTPVPTTLCGDGVIQTPNSSGIKEVCDNGSQNGTVCTPQNGKSCNYCNTTCTQVIVVEPTPIPQCGDGIKQSNEVCDDGNLANYDQCSNTCKNKCGSNEIWNGKKCVPIGCRADYNRNGGVGISDFRTFTKNFKKEGIDCSLDIKIKNGKCYLDASDLKLFNEVYSKTNGNKNLCK